MERVPWMALEVLSKIQNFRSGMFVIHSAKEFSDAATSILSSITTIHLSEKEIPEELKRESPGTLQVHQLRKKNHQGVWYLEFYTLSFEENPFYVQYYVKVTTRWSAGMKILIMVIIV